MHAMPSTVSEATRYGIEVFRMRTLAAALLTALCTNALADPPPAADAPPDLEGHLGFIPVTDGRQRHHRYLGLGGTAQPLDESGHLRL